jgi:hypothetical protein
LGRCSRLDSEDRSRLESGEIDWTDVSKMNKPYSYIILPELTMTNKDDMAQMKQFVLQLRDYGFNPSEDIVGDANPFGLPEEEDLDMFNELNRNAPRNGNIIEFIKNEFEDERVANLSIEEQFNENLN